MMIAEMRIKVRGKCMFEKFFQVHEFADLRQPQELFEYLVRCKEHREKDTLDLEVQISARFSTFMSSRAVTRTKYLLLRLSASSSEIYRDGARL